MIDLHVHTARCRHASGEPLEYVAAARLTGVTTMAFTDHLPLPPGYSADYAMPERELPDYVDDVRAAADAVAASGGPQVLLGIEADWIPGNESACVEALERYPFDIVLGSVHMIDGWAFDDPDLRQGYERWDADALWRRYFDELAAAASSGLYDVMAHPDLVKKFNVRPTCDVVPLYREAAAVFGERGVAVEVSTAGLRKPCAEIYPALAFLRACRQEGVAATVGSDAHAPIDVGHGWASARELMLEAGYRSAVVFHSRVPEEVAL